MAMDERGAARGPAPQRSANFGLAPPRGFLLPAILLLLTEQPGYGYALVPRLREFRFGHVDRPAVYRALAVLEHDGLVTVESEDVRSGQVRRVYAPTPLGQKVLRSWMSVVREEHAHLGEVIRRYQATGTTEAVLAEVEGGWVPELDLEWSAVSTTSLWRRRLMPLDDLDEARERSDQPEVPRAEAVESTADSESAGGRTPARFELDPERSAVIIDARSTVGPISFGTVGVTGALYAVVISGAVSTEIPPTGRLTIDVSALHSGNKVYDAELRRRIDARRFPTATVELTDCEPSAPCSRYKLSGEITFHGVSRRAEGTVSVEARSDDQLVISGEQAFDVRDFAVPSPTMLMLRIFPDVRVRLHAEAKRVDV